MSTPAWSEDEADDARAHDVDVDSIESDRGVDFMRQSDRGKERVQTRVYIALYGKLTDVEDDQQQRRREPTGRKPVKQDLQHSQKPRRRCSAEVDWTVGERSQAHPSARQRLELKEAIHAYDTAYTQFSRLYRAMHKPPSPIGKLNRWRFIPEVEHVHVAYTAMMQSYVRLSILERAHWDTKSVCLEVDSVFAAFRSFVGSAFRDAAGWPVDFEARVPSMEEFYEALERQYRLKAYGQSIGASMEVEEEEDIEEVSDFEDALAQANRESTRSRTDSTKKSKDRPTGTTRRKSSKRQGAGSQGFQGARRRGT